jgi:hypothetical protein
MTRRRGRGHVRLSFQQFPAPAVGGDGRVVIVVEDLLQTGHHERTLAHVVPNPLAPEPRTGFLAVAGADGTMKRPP